MASMTALEQLNATKYVYLREISEPDKQTFNNLRVIVEEAVVNYGESFHSDRPEIQAVFKDAHPIESVAGCKRFRLFWTHYVGYLVTEESVGSSARNGYADEQFTGSIFRTYTKSNFLDHIARNTGGHIHDVQHFKLVCLDHLIDVASYYAPQIEVIDSPAETLSTK
ncbi:MAG: hypothetical protein LC754_09250 [Acidobacteria bacterium]|nr:hypothetical protein [Acidobacteriota bacterium]